MKRFHPLRATQQIRDREAEVHLHPGQFILPLFVVDGRKKKKEISSLRNVFHESADQVLFHLENSLSKGIRKHLLFGVIDPVLKDEKGTAAYSEKNVVSQAITEIRRQFGNEIQLFTDVCLCGYTNHGHCGLVGENGIHNDLTLPLLAAMAVEHAKAGADFVAPSAMMDGQVEAIRNALDANGYNKVNIMGYSAKYASGFYGPFREAAQSAPAFGDRKSYQLDYRTIGQGIGEAEADLAEGASWIMVKPAHAYLDMISRIRIALPGSTIAAYHVSGEYMLLKLAAEAGLIDELAAFAEVTSAIARAGADYIITYYAHELADAIKQSDHEINA
jgi:porphobilinogen synthase